MPSIKTLAVFGSIAIAGIAVGKYMEQRKLKKLNGQVDDFIAANPKTF